MDCSAQVRFSIEAPMTVLTNLSVTTQCDPSPVPSEPHQTGVAPIERRHTAGAGLLEALRVPGALRGLRNQPQRTTTLQAVVQVPTDMYAGHRHCTILSAPGALRGLRRARLGVLLSLVRPGAGGRPGRPLDPQQQQMGQMGPVVVTRL